MRRGACASTAAALTAASLAAAAALLVAPAETRAQAVRSGFWLEAAAGTGTVRNTCAGCPGVTVGFGSTYQIRAGGALNPRVLVGVEAFSLRTSELRLASGVSPVEAENVSIAPVVIWYVGRSGFFLKGGAGLARGRFTVESGGTDAVTTERTGSGLTFGVGFDIGVVRWLAVTANLATYVTAIGDVRVEGQLVDDVIATVYEAGVGITLR